MKDWLLIVRIVFTIWVIISIVIFFLKNLKPQGKDYRFNGEPSNYNYFIFLGAFLGCIFILSEGIEALLWFIPNSLVTYDAENEGYNKVKTSIAYFLGFLATFFFTEDLWWIS